MVKDKKKLAFTIAETLICMFILSIFIVLSMKVFTKKHQKPTYNPSHGYYMCYRDNAGRIMKKIGNAEPTGPYPDGCDFQPVKAANFYVMYAVGGGGGGNGSYGGGPGAFTTLFLTNIADTLKIIPGKGGAYNTNGEETIIKNNNPAAGADVNVLVAQGGLKGGVSRVEKDYIRGCTAVPLSKLLEYSSAKNYINTNIADKAECSVGTSSLSASLCSHRYEDVHQYDVIYGNSSSFWKTYKNDMSYAVQDSYLKSLTTSYHSKYRFNGNCLERGSSDQKYCFEADGDKLYQYSYSYGWYLVNQNTNKTSKCLTESMSYSFNLDDDKDSEIIIRDGTYFKFIFDMHYDLTKRNVTSYIKESGFGDYIINSGMKDESTAAFFYPESKSLTNPSKQFIPAAGDGGHRNNAGFPGAVFIAW